MYSVKSHDLLFISLWWFIKCPKYIVKPIFFKWRIVWWKILAFVFVLIVLYFCFQVYINVIDINDNSPLFLSPSYETTIPENMDVGMSIMKVSAIDKDENNRLFYTITAAENEISINKFDIDSRTGRLRSFWITMVTVLWFISMFVYR